MTKGLIVCGVLNIIIAGTSLIIGLNFLQPIRAFFLIFSVITLVPCVTLFTRTELVIKISVIALFSASLICGVMVLFSLAGVLDFSRSWLLSLILCGVYLLLTFYFIGFKGYLQESHSFHD